MFEEAIQDLYKDERASTEHQPCREILLDKAAAQVKANKSRSRAWPRTDRLDLG
jgi:hypothetical protein